MGTRPGRRRCGCRWAPLRVPLQRRCQTLAVLVMMSVPLLLAGVVALILLCPALTRWRSRELFALYCVWALVLDRRTPFRGGRVLRWFCRLPLWHWVVAYFPTVLHVAEPLDPAVPYVIAVHPHGIVSLSLVTSLCLDPLLPREKLAGDGDRELDYRIATVTFNTSCPVWREVLMAVGMVDASRASLDYCLSHGISAVIVPGGARESLHSRPGVIQLELDRRKGFIKLALAHGAPLVPVFSFGETELFSQVSNPDGSLVRRIQDALLRFTGFTVPFFFGRGIFQYSFGLLPRRVPLHVFVGRAIPVPRLSDPSMEVLNQYHELYIDKLQGLYNEGVKQLGLRVGRSGLETSRLLT